MTSQKQQPTTSDAGVVSRSARTSFRAFSNCLRVISSGASTVARSAASAVNRDIVSPNDQVLWAGFDKLEKEDGYTRIRVLLLAFHSGFQIWDVEDTDNVHLIVSAHDGRASFMQMLPNPEALDDMFSVSRPLLAVCGDSSWEENSSIRQSVSDNPGSETVVPTNVHVYSLKSQSYVHTLKFRSIIYTVRCSSRIVAVLQASQIHCFDAKTLEKEYMIVTNSISYGSLGVGYGPLAVGPRWIAYSGSRVADSSSTLFTPELITLPSSSPSVAQFAMESSRQIASGILNIGMKSVGVTNDNVLDEDRIGMVIIKDMISKSVIAQFKAHKSPISALSFDPSGMLLVTASIQGHNINVFRIMPRSTASFVHLFRLQRGFTHAVIQDISFSNDSGLIVISSSRGTSHMFEIDPHRVGKALVPLSAVNRIRSGNISGWMGTMSGAAAAAAGMVGSSLTGAAASSFCYCVEQNKNNRYGSAASDNSSRRSLLVFAPSGCMTQYPVVGSSHEAALGFDFESGSEIEPVQRWSMVQNQSRREMQDQHSDIYGGGTVSDSKSRVFPEIVRNQNAEESWKVTKKEDKHQMYMSEAELQMYQPSRLPLWGRRHFRFQELVLKRDDEESSNGGGGEMEIEGIQTRTIEARTRDLVPAWGYLHSPKSQQVMKESLQSPRNTTLGDHVAPTEDHGGESDPGVVHSKEGSSRSEEESSRSDEDSYISEEETQSKSVHNEEGIAEVKKLTEDEDDEEIH
ncbi:autophagy-related protein 18f-like [Brassica napus]|uniref:autophagy-related protein 18f-like n=1 Tax=Brassica napus TaxID=3708 RepID=UPI0006AB0BD1|nr:autophagy-related protein 18f-like [Brassica napus]